MKSRVHRSLFVILLAGVTAGVFVRETCDPSVYQLSSSCQQTAALPAAKAPAPSPKDIAGPHLHWAADEIDHVLDEHLQQIHDVFADAKKHTRHFADRALSLSSKWRLVADKVPFTRGGRHEAFLRSQFEEHIFKPDDLKDVVEQVIASYMAHIRSIESQMLVKVRADIADFPETYFAANFDESEFREQYDQALMQALRAAKHDLQADIGTLIVTEMAGTVLADVALKLGVSAGILGTAAASSWTTFGVGVVVGLIIDQIVSWVWDWYADPKGRLVTELNNKLDSIRRLIVDGSGDVPGLRSRLSAFANERARLRETAVLAILQAN